MQLWVDEWISDKRCNNQKGCLNLDEGAPAGSGGWAEPPDPGMSSDGSQRRQRASFQALDSEECFC